MQLGILKGKRTPPIDRGMRRVYMTLHRVQRKRALIYVRFDRHDVTYQSIILKLAPERRYIVIDELFPGDDGFVALPGDPCTVEVRERGTTLSFGTAILDRGVEDGVHFYRIELPSRIDNDQRRGAFRVRIDRSLDATTTIRNPEGDAVSSDLRNLSLTGVKLEVHGDGCEAFEKGALLPACRFRLGDETELECDLEVRRVDASSHPYPHVVVGAKFVELPAVRRRWLERYLVKLQRDQRKD